MPEMRRTYRFNRPVSLLILLPLLLLIVMLVAGILRSFSPLSLVLVLFSLVIVGSVVYYSLLRSLTVGPEGLVWKAPGVQYQMALAEIKHFGIVKYRSFRFIYLSRAEAAPFSQADARIVSSADTFVIQYRGRAWKQVKSLMKTAQPELKPSNLLRGR